MPLATTLEFKINANYTKVDDLATEQSWLQKRLVYGWLDGVGADLATFKWDDQRTITSSSSENLDLAGVLTDAFGAVLTFTKVRLLYVEALTTNVNNVIVGGAASNTWLGPFSSATHTCFLPPGASAIWIARDAASYAVTASTADQLKIANSGSGSSVVYNIVILGC